MAKLQCTVSDELDEVIARVEIKTSSRERALEYLIYLARFIPMFTKKKYSGKEERNCTLPLDDARYAEDFVVYRETHIKKWRKKKHFFPDALGRGASMYEFGYRLSTAKTPREAELQPDSAWQNYAAQVASIIEFSKDPTSVYDSLKDARRSHEKFIMAALFLLEKFPDHHVDSTAADNLNTLRTSIVDFEREANADRRVELARSFVAQHSSRGVDLASFDDWSAIPRREEA